MNRRGAVKKVKCQETQERLVWGSGEQHGQGRAEDAGQTQCWKAPVAGRRAVLATAEGDETLHSRRGVIHGRREN